MGLTINYICEECVEDVAGEFIDERFDIHPFEGSMHVYPGNTTQEQVTWLLEYRDGCELFG
jgi:hypothetical protein